MVKQTAKWMLKQLLRISAFRTYLEEQVRAKDPILNDPTVRFAPPGHFYSPLPNLAEVEKNGGRLYTAGSTDDGVRLNTDDQRRLLVEIAKHYARFDWGDRATPGRRFYLKNEFFGHGDAVVLFLMICHFHPRRIIEVGSGFSSALMLDANDRCTGPRMELCFIEPYPDRLEGLLTPGDRASTRLVAAPVQSVPLEEFDALGLNDILFIDSSHVSKIGSDVNYLFFSVLPRLRRGVLVHFHDIFYPFEYPLEWVREGRAWNEIYLLRAFLQYNSAFEIMFFNNYLWRQDASFVKQYLPLMSINPGGSLWLRKTSDARDPLPQPTPTGTAGLGNS